MSGIERAVTALTPDDLQRWPVWELRSSDNVDGFVLVAVEETLPVSIVEERIFGTEVMLANDTRLWGYLQGYDLLTQQFNYRQSELTLFFQGKRITLGAELDRHLPGFGASDLSAALGLSNLDIFSIKFDVSALLNNPLCSVRGSFDS
jgi:hypothetical protein